MPQTSGIVIFEYIDWGKSMARQRGSRTGRCQGCNHLERVRIERLLAAGASIKGAARKFAIDYHALRRHWRNHVSAEARAAYIAGVGATKDQLEEIVADETLALRRGDSPREERTSTKPPMTISMGRNGSATG